MGWVSSIYDECEKERNDEEVWNDIGNFFKVLEHSY